MKSVEELTVCVCDFGAFISLADKLAEQAAKVYYFIPTDCGEFHDIKEVVGQGVSKFERVGQIMSPEILKQIDLFIFPDIGFSGLQRYLRSIGKSVWGSMGLYDLELDRQKFLDFLREHKLPMANSNSVTGLSELADYLKITKDKWVKINVFRNNMETWHHVDWEHSQRILEDLAVTFGGWKEQIGFVVQDCVPTDVEIGYDGWTVDGQYPVTSYQGYEKKNELYLGAATKYEDLPDGVRRINEALSDVLKKVEYRNFMATEIRMKDGEPFFIDPTLRMPGQTGEQLLETCSNLLDVMWQGAQGNLIEPNFVHKFATSATLHYKDGMNKWKVLKVPESVRQWVKFGHYAEADGLFHFFPRPSDEVGVILGVGETIEDAIQNLKDHFKELEHEPLSIDDAGFMDLVKSAKEGEKEGVVITDDKVPDPAEVVENRPQSDEQCELSRINESLEKMHRERTLVGE